jgi:hypothetical protein
VSSSIPYPSYGARRFVEVVLVVVFVLIFMGVAASL